MEGGTYWAAIKVWLQYYTYMHTVKEGHFASSIRSNDFGHAVALRDCEISVSVVQHKL